MSPLTYLISGSSRGLGLEFVRQILAHEPKSRIIAAARNPDKAEALQKLIKENPGRVETLKLDVGDVEAVKAAAAEAEKLSFAQDGIDILFNNAGVLEGQWGDILDPNIVNDLNGNFAVNVVGVVAATQAFLPLLRKGNKKIIWNTSSVCGSLGGPFSQSPTAASYSVSKAALNMVTIKFARALASEDFTVLSLHPGWVKTDMGGTGADIEVEESISGSLKTLHSKTVADSGSFHQWNGKPLEW